jgi:hypothetical protein
MNSINNNEPKEKIFFSTCLLLQTLFMTILVAFEIIFATKIVTNDICGSKQHVEVKKYNFSFNENGSPPHMGLFYLFRFSPLILISFTYLINGKLPYLLKIIILMG